MEQHQRLDGAAPEITKLELSLHLGAVVVVDVDEVLLSRRALCDVLGVLRKSGLIGPSRWVRERVRARRLANSDAVPSMRYISGVRVDDLTRLMQELAPDLVCGADLVMLDLIAMHVRSGDFVVICTDAPQMVADALAIELGVQRGVGTHLDAGDGLLTGEIVTGAEGATKFARLEAAIGAGALAGAQHYRSRP